MYVAVALAGYALVVLVPHPATGLMVAIQTEPGRRSLPLIGYPDAVVRPLLG